MSLVVTGVDQVQQGLVGLADDVTDLDALDELAQRGEALAARGAPVKTGRLRAGIEGTVTAGRAQITTSRDTVGYAGAQERIHHYMARAQQQLEADAPEITADSINRATNRRGLT